jgi:hypothetical protein
MRELEKMCGVKSAFNLQYLLNAIKILKSIMTMCCLMRIEVDRE